MLGEMSGLQFEEWKKFYQIKAWEHEQEMRKAK